jgi:hypothetical protein
MPLQDVFNFANKYPSLLGLATFVIGLYFGNKQAIGRDRRKEFNEISEDAFIALNKQIEQLKVGLPGQCVSDFFLINNYVPFYKRWHFHRHVEIYKKAQ